MNPDKKANVSDHPEATSKPISDIDGNRDDPIVLD